VIYFQSQFRPPLPTPCLVLGGNLIIASQSVKDLGCHLDVHLTMVKEINAKIKACCYQIRSIGSIRAYLDTETCKTLVNSTVTSKLDYCNSLLMGCNSTLIGKLQRVQNMAARLVSRCTIRDHITPVLEDLHWLPVQARIEYSILLFVFKAREGLAPSYISELVKNYAP